MHVFLDVSTVCRVNTLPLLSFVFRIVSHGRRSTIVPAPADTLNARRDIESFSYLFILFAFFKVRLKPN